MKFYLIFEKTQPGTKKNRPTFVVSDKEVAKAVCKEFYFYYYEERETNEDTQTSSILTTPQNEKTLYGDIKCPYCGKSHFIIGGGMSTAMYCPTIIKDGKVISEDHNIVTTEYECLECGKYFKSVNGVIQKDDERNACKPETVIINY